MVGLANLRLVGPSISLGLVFSRCSSRPSPSCLNVPAPDDGMWRVAGRRLFWMGLTIAGPEFVLTYTSGQWGTAKESVQLFRALGYPKWILRHGFFADMGRFLFVPRDSNPFPITSKHLHWLVSKSYLTFPDVSSKELWDKSKQDTVAEVITYFQISYLIIQWLRRAAQHLTITTMELSTLAIVVCSIRTSIWWLDKPLNVMTPIQVYSDRSMEEIIRDAGEADSPWKQTPLDFINDLGPSWALNVQPFMKMPVGPHKRHLPRFGNVRLPNLDGRQETILCIATLAYAAIHLVGWNFTFPTRVELILWRASSMFLFGNTVTFWIFETATAWHRKGRWRGWLYQVIGPSRSGKMELKKQERIANEVTRPPQQLPLAWEFWSIFPLAVTYATARAYLAVEVFLRLRSLKPSAFATVD